MEITLITGNWAKLEQAKQFLEPHGITVNNIKMDTIEIQADTIEEVARYSAKWASDKLKMNVLKKDTGIMIEGLNGFPAAYTHYVQDTIGIDGILKLMKGVKNRKAKFIQTLAYCEYGKDPIVFSSITEGVIAAEKSGKYGWSWDFIFIPKGYEKTFANYKDEERLKMWNDTGYRQLIKYLNK